MSHKFIKFIILIIIISLTSCTSTVISEETLDNKNTIIIRTENNAFPFGSETIHIKFKEGIFEKKIFKYEISNDGKSLDNENIYIFWRNSKCYIRLSGEEQFDELYEIVFGKTVNAVKLLEYNWGNKIEYFKQYEQLLKELKFEESRYMKYFISRGVFDEIYSE